MGSNPATPTILRFERWIAVDRDLPKSVRLDSTADLALYSSQPIGKEVRMIRIVYVSQPFGFDDATLNSILLSSRRNNLRNDVTGALICRADAYVQLIEGPETAIRATYTKIASDDRHLDVKLLIEDEVSSRLFPGWAMRDDPARSWMWTQAQVAAGAIAAATRSELLAVFERLSAESP